MKAIRIWCLMISLVMLPFGSCQKSTDPNDISGDTNIELTKVGGKFISFFYTEPWNANLERLRDTVVITKNDNGLVTFNLRYAFDSVFAATLDTVLGIAGLPSSMKTAALDVYLKRMGLSIDTTDKANIRVYGDVKARVTSEGIQEFFSSNNDLSKPHTLVKYGWNVGDKYEFTNADGQKVTRTVIEKSTTDDYELGFFRIKVIKVEDVSSDPLIEKTIYIANHKFGFVDAIMKMKNGKELRFGVFPPNL